MNILKGQIGNALTSVAANHVVSVADDIYDEALQKYQSELNEKALRQNEEDNFKNAFQWLGDLSYERMNETFDNLHNATSDCRVVGVFKCRVEGAQVVLYSSVSYWADEVFMQEAVTNIQMGGETLAAHTEIKHYQRHYANGVWSSWKECGQQSDQQSEQQHVFLEQSEFDAMSEFKENCLYFVMEEVESPAWKFGDAFPITF